MLTWDVLGYLLGFCPTLTALKFLCCCKETKDSFVWNHLVRLQDISDDNKRVRTICQHLHRHRDELLRFNEIDRSILFTLGNDRYQQLVRALAPRAQTYLHNPSLDMWGGMLPVMHLNRLMLVHLDIRGCVIDSAIELFTVRLPNLQDLSFCVYSTTVDGLIIVEDPNQRSKLLEKMGNNTGALTHISVCMEEQDRMDNTMVKHLRNLCDSNPGLRILDISIHGYDQFVSSPFDLRRGFLMNLSPEKASKSPLSTLPDRVQASLGITISQLRFAGCTMMEHLICDQFISGVYKSWNALDKLWESVYPAASYEAARALSVYRVHRQRGYEHRMGELVQWIHQKAITLFDSIDLEKVRLRACLRDLFGIIFLVLRYDFATSAPHDLVVHAFNLACLHCLESPFSLLVTHFIDILESGYLCAEQRMAEDAATSFLEVSSAAEMRTRLFHEEDSHGHPLAWRMFLYLPKTLLAAFQNADIFDLDEQYDAKNCSGLSYMVDQFIAQTNYSEWKTLGSQKSHKHLQLMRFVLDHIRLISPHDTRPNRVVLNILRWCRRGEVLETTAPEFSLLTVSDLLQNEIMDSVAMFGDAYQVIRETWNRCGSNYPLLERLLSLAASSRQKKLH